MAPRGPGAAADGLHGAFGFPIVLGSRVSGVMEFFSRAPQNPDPDLVETMAPIGAQIGQFLQRKQAEEALRASEALPRAMLASALDGRVTLAQEGIIRAFSPDAERMAASTRRTSAMS